MEKPICVNSEIGRLKTVMLHRPGAELEALTPDYMSVMLFDDVPYLKIAQKEHDEFAQLLRDHGVEVLYLEQLVAESLYNDEIKLKFIRDMVRASKQGDTHVTNELIKYLYSFDTKEMVLKLMAGVKKEEVLSAEPINKNLHHYFVDDYPFYLDPMPNLYFTRDPFASVGEGLTINKMHWPARRRESLFMSYIVAFHPRFNKSNLPIWLNRDSRFSIEGGDELVLSGETLAVGMGERTQPEAVEKLASRLLTNSNFKRVMAIKIPSKRAFMHLDTVFTMVDRDKFTIHPAILHEGGKLDIFLLEKADNRMGYQIARRQDLAATLSEVLGLYDVTLIPCGDGDPIAAAREQWNDGSNTLAIAPGVVVTYDRNYVTNAALRRNGLEVLEVTGSELSRGRGGPRCMSMPMIREAI